MKAGRTTRPARALDAAGIRSFDELLSEARELGRSYPGSIEQFTAPVGENTSGQAAPYAVGFLAADELARQAGEGAIFEFWDLLAESRTWQEAFQAAFGEPAEAFVSRFDAERATAPDLLTGGIRGKIRREDGSAVPGVSVIACIADTLDCRGTWTDFSGTFELALPAASYDVFYEVPTRESRERGKVTTSDGEAVIAVSGAFVEGLEATVRKKL